MAKLLLLVTDDWFFWSHRLHLARAVRDAGCEVHVATSAGKLRARIEAEGFRFHAVSFARTLASQPMNAALVLRLARLYAAVRPDLVHHVSFLPILYGSLAARLARVPAIVNAVTGLGHAFVGSQDRRAPGGLTRRALEACYRLALAAPGARTIFQNEEDRDLFVQRALVAPERAVLVAGAGVDTELFHPLPEPPGPPVVLLVARMLWSKGIGVLVEAGRLLRSRGAAPELRLLGEPHASNPDSIPEAQLSAWDARGEARWLGRQEDVAHWMQAAHVVCLPSYYREGVPLALIEGAACGRALVTADTPGCRDIVRHGENGLVVPPRDPQALAAALAALIAAPERRAEMGRRGRALVLECFSKERVNARILEVYRELSNGAWSGAASAPPERSSDPQALERAPSLAARAEEEALRARRIEA